ncbi:hypothetical protein EUTSA_v10008353mg [Eutrema salsugineum]|uniref:SHSP domain-containing protein n=1 Tax=Eutrema salsugineum TaxID=72664 RepID=V4L919_EUTSA|nr:hypothetical protein EUTSA_v10008353mg [Eutrema salsugineum]
MNFARQASSAQGFFMRQASSTDEVTPYLSSSCLVIKAANDPPILSTDENCFKMFLQRTIPQDTASTKCSAAKTNGFLSSIVSKPEYAPPQFSKAAKEKFASSSDSSLNQEKDNWKKPSKADLPKLANLGTVWSPRSNVAEFEHNYVVAVELPGASINDIRVEVDNTDLTVTGRRTSICQKVDACTKDSVFGYHKQEILQGPFKVSWPLPSNVNKDNVSAEFMDGLLRIVIPKL